MNPHDYLFIAVLGGLFAGLDAFGIGANDVANSFATSVGSRSLTLLQACLIASVCEFLGAILLGASVSDTIKGGLLKATVFQSFNPVANAYFQAPESLMLVMQCALIGSSSWVLIATFFGLPVSTTHSIVGAILGAGMAGFGPAVVQWDNPAAADISKRGVLSIVLGWFISPVLAGGIAAFIFGLVKYTVLVWDSAYKRALYTIPLFFFGTFAINIFFIIYKGAPANADLSQMSLGLAAGISLAVGGGIAILSAIFLVPILNKRIKSSGLTKDSKSVFYGLGIFQKPTPPAEVSPSSSLESPVTKPTSDKPETTQIVYVAAAEGIKDGKAAPEQLPTADQPADFGSFEPKPKGFFAKAKAAALHGVTVDVVGYSDDMHDMHSRAKHYDARAEALYSFLQVCTACFASFAHGSNDVANAVGPFSAIMDVYETGKLPVRCGYASLQGKLVTAGAWESIDAQGKKVASVYQTQVKNTVCGQPWVDSTGVLGTAGASFAAGSFSDAKVPVPVWILAFGGGMIVLGLATWGYNIMRVLGNKLTYQSPSRGFSMELGATFTVLLASKLGLPVSTTQCITGATLGVGLMNLDLHAVNWLLFAKVFFGWALTLPFAGLTAGLFFGYANNTPNLGTSIGVAGWRS